MRDDVTITAEDLEDALAEWYATRPEGVEVSEQEAQERDALVASIVAATGKRAVDVRGEAAERGEGIAFARPPSAA